MDSPKKPVFRKSMIPTLSLSAVMESLEEIAENGDCYGYDRAYVDEEGVRHIHKSESGYYQEYAELFNELSAGATDLLEALYGADYEAEQFDDFTVALLGETHTVYGFDAGELDYFVITDPYNEHMAVQHAVKRATKLTKADMVTQFRRVMSTLLLWMDLKASHDALCAIVTELDYKGALLETKNDVINRLYEDITGGSEEDFDRLVQDLPQRMWLE